MEKVGVDMGHTDDEETYRSHEVGFDHPAKTRL